MSASFTGVPGVGTEDAAVCLSMGPIFDRTKEHLVPADLMVSRVRRRLLSAARDLAAGTEPQALDPEDTFKIGGDMKLLSDPQLWREEIAFNNADYRIAKTAEVAAAE